MVLAMRHGVLGYEAMDLNRLLINFPFGVFNYAATRRVALLCFFACLTEAPSQYSGSGTGNGLSASFQVGGVALRADSSLILCNPHVRYCSCPRPR